MNDDSTYEIVPVGVAHTPYRTPADAPHQGFVGDAESTVEIFEPYEGALAGIEGVHRVLVVYFAHLADRSRRSSDDGGGSFTRRTPHVRIP